MSSSSRGSLSVLLLGLLSLVAWCPRAVVGDSRSEGPPYTTCDADCQRQVKILEGFIIFVILGFALGVILCCMKCIDVPTKFSSPGGNKARQE